MSPYPHNVTNIVISPSGQFYGSENVLFNLLTGSEQHYHIYAPEKSDFLNKLKTHGFDVSKFKNLKLLYLKVFIQLLFQRKNLLLNEAGHIKYLKALARLLPSLRFIVIVRLLEDCNSSLTKLPKNIEIIAVSNFIKSKIISNRPIHVIHDPYQLNDENTIENKPDPERYTVAIVGRLTITKGLDHFLELINYLSSDQKRLLTFKFYGSYDNKNDWFKKFKLTIDNCPNLSYEFMGFEKSQGKIFNTSDIVLHLNKKEALGRILFEAIDYNKPFLCFNEGGAGELAQLLELEHFTFNRIRQIPEKLINIRKINNSKAIAKARDIIKNGFSPENYALQIEKYL